MASGVGEYVQGLVGVAEAVQEKLRTEVLSALTLPAELFDVGHRHVDVQLHGNVIRWPGCRPQRCDLLEGERAATARVHEDEPIAIDVASVCGRFVAVPVRNLSTSVGQLV